MPKRHGSLYISARTLLDENSNIRFHWCDYTFDCYGIHGVIPEELPNNSLVQLDSVQIDPNSRYPGLAGINFHKDPRKLNPFYHGPRTITSLIIKVEFFIIGVCYNLKTVVCQ